ncbi:MAG: hypothetical protein GWP50_11015 [Proteobacteria bacterium]|nr:hypothetical protein [Pseudomonadota bacterium]
MGIDMSSNEQPDDPALFKALAKPPNIAWPTVLVAVAAYVLFGGATYAYITDQLPLVWAIALNTIAAYLSFTPTHAASHHAVSNNRQLNDWIGRLATVLQSPVPFFRTFRYIHMQHHRFTNDQSKDPDVYVGTGPRWLLPLKWITLDLSYLYFYLRPSVFSQRPKSERKELVLAFFFGAAIFVAVTYAGWLEYYVLLFLLPGRITALFLAIAFDFLPHYPHQTRAQDLPFQATSNRIGLEWLLTPVLLFQNYHLVHHLYPTVPFYRYLKIWNAKKHYHQAQRPATTGPFSLHAET